MLSLRTSALVLVASFAAAQQQYQIDPESVDINLRNVWCDNELSTCPLLCQQVEPRTTELNTCEPENLTFRCVCGDGNSPNMTEYTLTLPYFICQEWGTQCVTNCEGNNSCASSCREDNPCGARDPSPPNSTTSATTSAPTATRTDDSDTIFTNAPGSSDSNSNDDDDDSAAALSVSRTYGLAVVFGTLFAGFAML